MNRTDWQARIGVGERCAGYGPRTGPTRIRPVIADDGPLAGRQVGKARDHADGRVDAKATAFTVQVAPNLTARKEPHPCPN